MTPLERLLRHAGEGDVDVDAPTPGLFWYELFRLCRRSPGADPRNALVDLLRALWDLAREHVEGDVPDRPPFESAELVRISAALSSMIAESAQLVARADRYGIDEKDRRMMVEVMGVLSRILYALTTGGYERLGPDVLAVLDWSEIRPQLELSLAADVDRD